MLRHLEAHSIARAAERLDRPGRRWELCIDAPYVRSEAMHIDGTHVPDLSGLDGIVRLLRRISNKRYSNLRISGSLGDGRALQTGLWGYWTARRLCLRSEGPIAFRPGLLLGMFGHLEELDVSYCLIGDAGAVELAQSLGKVPRMKRLNLAHTGIRGSGFRALADHLHEADLAYLNLNGLHTAPADLEYAGRVSRLTTLKYLHLQDLPELAACLPHALRFAARNPRLRTLGVLAQDWTQQLDTDVLPRVSLMCIHAVLGRAVNVTGDDHRIFQALAGVDFDAVRLYRRVDKAAVLPTHLLVPVLEAVAGLPEAEMRQIVDALELCGR